jgi:signal peptidase II
MASARNNGRVFWAAAAGVIILDVITKALAVRYLMPQHMPHPIMDLFGSRLRSTRRRVQHVAGLTRESCSGPAFIASSFCGVCTGRAGDDTIRVLALGLAWGGAAGNLIDRFLQRDGIRNGVVDFIDVGVGDVRFWTFNVADSAVTVGALMLAWVLWREDRRALATAAAEAAARDV